MKRPWAVTNCKTHGRWSEEARQYEIKLNIPVSKRIRMSGCPHVRSRQIEKQQQTNNNF